MRIFPSEEESLVSVALAEPLMSVTWADVASGAVDSRKAWPMLWGNDRIHGVALF